MLRITALSALFSSRVASRVGATLELQRVVSCLSHPLFRSSSVSLSLLLCSVAYITESQSQAKLCITVLLGNCLSAAEGHLHCLIDTFYGYQYESTDCRLSACLPGWLRGCLMTSNDCTRDRIAIKYRIFGFKVWRSSSRSRSNQRIIEQTIECIHQILLLCLPPLNRSTDLNDRNVHEISICSNVIFEHNFSIDEGGSPPQRERAREGQHAYLQ